MASGTSDKIQSINNEYRYHRLGVLVRMFNSNPKVILGLGYHIIPADDFKIQKIYLSMSKRVIPHRKVVGRLRTRRPKASSNPP